MPLIHVRKKDELFSIKERYRFVLPGDKNKKRGSALVIVEDALYNVYHDLFPLCKEYNIRILLGVAPRYICESTTVASHERLNIPYALSMQDEFFTSKTPFCTWNELYEMVRSGLIEVASHSFSKMNLTFPFVNLEREIIESKQLLEKRLPQAISSFIYPFRQTTKRVHTLVSEHYQYIY